MLGRWVFTVWGAWLGTLGLAAALTASQVLHPDPILPAGLPILMVAAWLGLLVAATVRLIRGPRRDMALASLLVGTAPIWFSVGHVLMAIRPALDLHVPPGWASRVLLSPGRSLADLEARWFYPERTPGKWVTMVGTTSKDARAQVAAMDRHVDALLARLDQPATWPIVWYRGSLLGLGRCAIYDMALGSEVGQWPPGADGLTDLDRHEVAHCVITRNCTARSDPPRVLMEGWAQANQGTPAAELAVTAWDDHQKGLSLTLRQLVAPDWYWYSGPAAYNQGAPLANYLLRVYGPARFLKLYTTCQQATFDADCRATLGIGLDELEAAFWADTERIARFEPPARVWLKGLKLDPSVEPAAWDAFLTDYFAAAERLLAPYDRVRLTTTFRIERGNKAASDDPYEWEERLTLLRSGPFARVRHLVSGHGRYERAILAHPDHSLWAFRELSPELGPWTIEEDVHANPLQAYRLALSKVESESDALSGNAFFRQSRRCRIAGLSPDPQRTRTLPRARSGPSVHLDRRWAPADHARVAVTACGGRRGRSIGAHVRLRGRRFVRSPVAPLRITQTETRLGLPFRVRPSGRPPRSALVRHDDTRSEPDHSLGCRGVPVRSDSRDRIRGRTVPGRPQARRDHPEAGRKARDRDASRLVLDGVRRRRDQPGKWVRPGTEKSRPRRAGAAGGLKGMLSPRTDGHEKATAGIPARRAQIHFKTRENLASSLFGNTFVIVTRVARPPSESNDKSQSSPKRSTKVARKRSPDQ